MTLDERLKLEVDGLPVPAREDPGQVYARGRRRLRTRTTLVAAAGLVVVAVVGVGVGQTVTDGLPRPEIVQQPAASPDDTATGDATDTDDPCMGAAEQAREQAARDGLAPSEQRRRGDEAFTTCLDRQRSETPPPAGAVSPCEQDQPVAPADDELLVYFSCRGEQMSGDDFTPTGPVVRSVPEGASAVQRVRTALEALLAGPTGTETERGYISFIEPSQPEQVVAGVAVSPAGAATVDLAAGFVELLSEDREHVTGNIFIVEQLHATVSAVTGVGSVNFSLEGSCERFDYATQVVLPGGNDCDTADTAGLSTPPPASEARLHLQRVLDVLGLESLGGDHDTPDEATDTVRVDDVTVALRMVPSDVAEDRLLAQVGKVARLDVGETEVQIGTLERSAWPAARFGCNGYDWSIGLPTEQHDAATTVLRRLAGQVVEVSCAG